MKSLITFNIKATTLSGNKITKQRIYTLRKLFKILNTTPLKRIFFIAKYAWGNNTLSSNDSKEIMDFAKICYGDAKLLRKWSLS